jgi:hypothetical protein
VTATSLDESRLETFLGLAVTDLAAAENWVEKLRLVWVAAMAWSGWLPVASRRTPGGLTREIPAAFGLALVGCVVSPGCLFAA